MQQWGQALAVSQEGNPAPAKWGDSLAAHGRKGDTEIAHVTPGEIVVPRDIIEQNPQLRDIIAQAMSQYGADVNQFTVGHHMQSINPATGQPEFGFLGSIGDFFKKILSNPITRTIASIAVAAIPGVGPALSAALSAGVQGIGTKLAGGSWGQALGAAAGSYLGGKVGFGSGTLGNATVGSTIKSVGSSIGANSLKDTLVSALPGAISNTPLTSLAGSFVGNSIGQAVGASIDPPKQKWGTSQLINSPSLTAPTGNLNAAVAATTAAGGPTGAGSQASSIPINYVSQVKNRDTGQLERVTTPYFVGGLDTSRRQGWGSGVSFA